MPRIALVKRISASSLLKSFSMGLRRALIQIKRAGDLRPIRVGLHAGYGSRCTHVPRYRVYAVARPLSAFRHARQAQAFHIALSVAAAAERVDLAEMFDRELRLHPA